MSTSGLLGRQGTDGPSSIHWWNGVHKSVAHRDTIRPHWRCEKVRYRYWNPGFAHTPAAKLSRSGWTIATGAPACADHLAASGSAPTNRTWQRKALTGLGIPEGLIYVHHGLTGRNKNGRDRTNPWLLSVPATIWSPPTSRFARCLPDARDIIEVMTRVSQEFRLATGMIMRI